MSFRRRWKMKAAAMRKEAARRLFEYVVTIPAATVSVSQKPQPTTGAKSKVNQPSSASLSLFGKSVCQRAAKNIIAAITIGTI